MEYKQAVNEHYGAWDPETAILNGLRAQGIELENVQPEDLGAVDQFHSGGREATLALAQAANVVAGERVLDVGGGLGGPARTLAQKFGCRVTVLDLTREFIRAGEKLTELTRLQDFVRFQWGSALEMPFEDNSFDLVWTQHASMNIQDKDKLDSEIVRVLRPGGRFAFHDIMAGPNQPIHFPVPWADTPDISFLEPPQVLRERLTALGMRERVWLDETTAALEFAVQRAQAMGQDGAPPALGLHLLMGARFATVFRNIAKNLQEGRIVVVEGVFEKG